MVPTQVMQKSGGPWWPWVSGSVDPATLQMRVGRGSPCYVNGTQVYALKFEDGRVWTPANGWGKGE